MGWGALMMAWTHELHGRGDQIQTLIGGNSEDSDEFGPVQPKHEPDRATRPCRPPYATSRLAAHYHNIGEC